MANVNIEMLYAEGSDFAGVEVSVVSADTVELKAFNIESEASLGMLLMGVAQSIAMRSEPSGAERTTVSEPRVKRFNPQPVSGTRKSKEQQ